MNAALLDYFRCPKELSDVGVCGELSSETGFFQFGQGTIGFGRCAGGSPSKEVGQLKDILPCTRVQPGRVELPFELTQVVSDLRCERYAPHLRISWGGTYDSSPTRRIYYFLRPVLPVSLRKHLQRASLRGWSEITFPHWPVDFTVESLLERVLALLLKSHGMQRMPFIWFWPDGASSCAIMTHDVEGAAGHDFCGELMDLDDRFSVKSSFQIVPEARYAARNGFLDRFRARGFEINVHDLHHDGSLFRGRKEFAQRAKQINRYTRDFEADGFRSGAMYRNQDWYDAFDFSYDMSVPNVAHLEPQRGGCCTVMPYFIGKILELPLTTIQDYSLFHILDNYSIDLWEQQINLIMRKNGLVSFITHPDYLIEKRAQAIYRGLLSHLARLRDQRKLWLALPREVNRWWRNRHQMSLVRHGNQWRIEGPDSDKARVAYATLEGDRVVYSVLHESERTEKESGQLA
jgi:hypothetical protein